MDSLAVTPFLWCGSCHAVPRAPLFSDVKACHQPATDTSFLNSFLPACFPGIGPAFSDPLDPPSENGPCPCSPNRMHYGFSSATGFYNDIIDRLRNSPYSNFCGKNKLPPPHGRVKNFITRKAESRKLRSAFQKNTEKLEKRLLEYKTSALSQSP